MMKAKILISLIIYVLSYLSLQGQMNRDSLIVSSEDYSYTTFGCHINYRDLNFFLKERGIIDGPDFKRVFNSWIDEYIEYVYVPAGLEFRSYPCFKLVDFCFTKQKVYLKVEYSGRTFYYMGQDSATSIMQSNKTKTAAIVSIKYRKLHLPDPSAKFKLLNATAEEFDEIKDSKSSIFTYEDLASYIEDNYPKIGSDSIYTVNAFYLFPSNSRYVRKGILAQQDINKILFMINANKINACLGYREDFRLLYDYKRGQFIPVEN